MKIRPQSGDGQIGSRIQVIVRAELQISLLQERRTALISAAVTGKIDVRDWQPAAAQAVVGVECRANLSQLMCETISYTFNHK